MYSSFENEGVIKKSINYVKENKIKVFLIAGIITVFLIIIIIVVSSSGGAEEKQKQPIIEKTKEEKVEEILNIFPKKETMTYQEFLPKLNEYANEFKLDEDGRAWFAFKWISQHIKYISGNPKDPQGVYETGATVCHGYSRLFIAMVQAMGFPPENTQRIMGSVKLNNHCTGESDIGTVHEWTALKINGKWELFDARRGAGSGSGDSFKFGFNPFYYKTEPYQLIRDHYPDDDKFQFLDPPLTPQQYCDMGVIYNRFFTYGFTKIDPDLYFINTTNPSGTLKYYFDPKKPNNSFKFQLIKNNVVMPNTPITKTKDHYEVKYNLSNEGEYLIYFYGNDTLNATKFSLGGFQYLNYKK